MSAGIRYRTAVLKCSLLLLLLCCCLMAAAKGTVQHQIQQGWALLVKDEEVRAMETFSDALTEARQSGDTYSAAEALLYMGMCSYGTSYSNGLKYATAAMAEYGKLEKERPVLASTGRSRCLQLISTISCRQKKYRESIALSREALAGLSASVDTMGTAGLVYSTLGTAYGGLGMADSAMYYHRRALKEQQDNYNTTYLPGAYLKVGQLLLDKYDLAESRHYFDKALFLADSTGNKQASVLVNLALAKWYRLSGDDVQAGTYTEEAGNTAIELSDKAFYLMVLQEYIEQRKATGNYPEALRYEEEMAKVRETMYDLEKERIVKGLETAFRVSEKDRELALVNREKQIAHLTNYLLWGGICILVLLSGIVIYFLRRVNKRDRELHEAREQVRAAAAEQQKMQEQQLKNELEYKETQLSALALQMYQKNELMQELKERLDQTNLPPASGLDLQKILNRNQHQDQDWDDFNARFESINRNFYIKLKQHFPGISPNDLKICALIKLNLSIKEMAGILNISPDSVKTARYRLRKKFALNTEDNLTEFIMGLE